MSLPGIAKELVDRAYRSGDELAWQRADVTHIIDALDSSGYLLLGGEVWMVSDNGHVTGTIPQAFSTLPGIYAWSYEPSNQNVQDHWRDECVRSAAYNKQVIQTISPEQDTIETVRNHIWYNLCYVNQDEYNALGDNRSATI